MINELYRTMLIAAETWIDEVKERETDVELDLQLGAASMLCHFAIKGKLDGLVDEMSDDMAELIEKRLALKDKHGIQKSGEPMTQNENPYAEVLYQRLRANIAQSINAMGGGKPEMIALCIWDTDRWVNYCGEFDFNPNNITYSEYRSAIDDVVKRLAKLGYGLYPVMFDKKTCSEWCSRTGAIQQDKYDQIRTSQWASDMQVKDVAERN